MYQVRGSSFPLGTLCCGFRRPWGSSAASMNAQSTLLQRYFWCTPTPVQQRGMVRVVEEVAAILCCCRCRCLALALGSFTLLHLSSVCRLYCFGKGYDTVCSRQKRRRRYSDERNHVLPFFFFFFPDASVNGHHPPSHPHSPRVTLYRRAVRIGNIPILLTIRRQ